jgi:hypothetical protein
MLDGRKLDEGDLTVKVDGKTTHVDIRIPPAGFGDHELLVRAADRSPFANVTEARVTFGYVDTKNVAQAAMGAKVKVDSCYPNYTGDLLIDGDWKSCATSGSSGLTWASAETATEHWVEVILPKPAKVGSVALYWAYRKPSKKVEAQILRDGKWTTVGAAERTKPEQASTIIRFTPVTTDRVRVLQPAGCGREDRPNLMWVGEIAVRKAD